MAGIGKQFEINFENAISNPRCVIKGGKFRITILSDILLRLEYDEGGHFEDRPTELAMFRNFEVAQFGLKEDEKYLTITTKYFKLEYTKEKPFFGSKIAPDANLKVSLVGTDKIWYFGHPEARNFKGTGMSLDDGKPHYSKGLYSTDGFASIDDSKSMIFDEDGVLRKAEIARVDTYLFMYRRDFGKCLKDYFKLSGKPPLIPRYSLGIWWNKNERYSFMDTKNLLKTFNRHKLPISVLLLGDGWHLKDESDLSKFKTGFTFDSKLFPEPLEFTTYLHDRGVMVGLNVDPSQGIMTHEAHFDDFANALGLADRRGVPFNVFDKYILTNYLRYMINPLSALGVDFFWVDYNTNDAATLRALSYYHFRNLEKTTTARSMILARNGLVAAHRYPIHYSGQTPVSWKTLESLPYYNSTASNIGISWWSHDIGGYRDGIEDAELYVRYAQLGAFSPIFRFASKAGRYYKREPWLWDMKTFSIVRDYCNMRQRMIPYLYTEAYKYSNTGLPLIQPLYYKYPELYDEPKYKNEYFFGTELFVAPITVKKDNIMNRSIHRIFLPNGVWYDFKTGKKFPGNKRYVTFYKDEDYPVFARGGSIIPLADLEENRNVTNPPKTMELHIFPGRSNVYNLYEDDGYSSLYEDGYYILTKIEYNYLANNYTLIIRPTEGKSGIIPELRNYRLRFRNTKEAEEVIAYVGEDKVEVFKTYEEDTDFVVEIDNVETIKQLTVNCKGKDIEIDAVRLINEDIDSIISDLQIETNLKERVAEVLFAEMDIKKKRIAVRKLRSSGLDSKYVRMFLKLLEYIAEI